MSAFIRTTARYYPEITLHSIYAGSGVRARQYHVAVTVKLTGHETTLQAFVAHLRITLKPASVMVGHPVDETTGMPFTIPIRDISAVIVNPMLDPAAMGMDPAVVMSFLEQHYPVCREVDPKIAILGAITGDIVGSAFERHPTHREDFDLFCPRSHFTDDTVLTMAMVTAIFYGADCADALRDWFSAYPHTGYGPGFRKWAASPFMSARFSAGNGSAARASYVGRAFDTLEDVLREARLSALPTHSHPDGIAGAQAVAAAVYRVLSAKMCKCRGRGVHAFNFSMIC